MKYSLNSYVQFTAQATNHYLNCWCLIVILSFVNNCLIDLNTNFYVQDNWFNNSISIFFSASMYYTKLYYGSSSSNRCLKLANTNRCWIFLSATFKVMCKHIAVYNTHRIRCHMLKCHLKGDLGCLCDTISAYSHRSVSTHCGLVMP